MSPTVDKYIPGKDIEAMTTQYLSQELILSTSPLEFTLKDDFFFGIIILVK